MSCQVTRAGSANSNFLGRLCWPGIIMLAILGGSPLVARGQNVPLQKRLEQALESARAITNIEIQYDDLMWIKGKPISATESNDWLRGMKTPYPFAEDFTRTMHVTYTFSNGKYREEVHNESSHTNSLKLSETAFDGKLWSSYDENNHETRHNMVQQDGDNSNDMENGYNPLIQPFLFLRRMSDDCNPCALRFVDLRSPDVLNGLVLPEAESSNGMLCVSFSGLPLNGVDQTWGVSIEADDPDFRPRTISTTIHSGGKAPSDIGTVQTLSDYTNVGSYYFPTKLAWSMMDTSTNKSMPPRLVMTGTVSLVSLKIPKEIPDATFHLDESKADSIWNNAQFKQYGVGLLLKESGSNVVVGRIVLNSPGGRQDEIHAGDRIVSISESNGPEYLVHAGKAELSRAIARLRGPKGSPVRITFVPSGKDDSQIQVVTLVRGPEKSRFGGARLPTNGMKMPDIEMVVLTNRASEHLSDYAGKIVVLEFWASWCSPCQATMADMQLDFDRFPNWKDKVALITASIDDTADIAAKRIEARGWNQTHNIWLADKALKSLAVGAIPAAYVIDPNGRVVTNGVIGMDDFNITNVVNKFLETAQEH